MTISGDVGAAKTRLRLQLLARRRARPVAERAAAAEAVADALVDGLAGVRTLAAFVPEEIEPGHGRLPAEYHRIGARVLLPVVILDGHRLDWAVDTGEFTEGRYGLQEPVGPRLGTDALGAADAVVVPALSVAADGVRLGRGGGYYDRALVHARPEARLVAVVFDDELVAELPAEPHDRRVDAVVTPSGGWRSIVSG